MKTKVDVLHGKLDNVIWVLAIPLIITQLIESIYGLIDSWFVAKVSQDAVASVAFVGPIQDVANSIGIGVSLAGCSLVARYIGAGDAKNAKKMTGQVITIGFAIGVLCSAVFYFFYKEVLIGADLPETSKLWEQASIYLRITSWSVGFNFVTVICLAIERASGNTKQAIPINMTSLVLKLFFTWLFTMNFQFGLVGIAYATVIAKGVCALICIILLIVSKNENSVSLSSLGLDMGMIKLLLITAVPLAVEKSLVSYGFVMTNGFVLAVGEDVLTAYGLTNKVNTVFFKTVSSFGMALSVIIAQNVGAGNIERAEQGVKKAMFFSVAVGCVAMLFVWPGKELIAGMFLEVGTPAYHSMVNAISVYAVAVIPWAVTETVMGIFQGTANTVYNLTVSMVRIYVLRLPVVWFFALPALELGEFGIWYAMLLSNVFAAMFSYFLYRKNRHKIFKPVIEASKEAETP